MMAFDVIQLISSEIDKKPGIFIDGRTLGGCFLEDTSCNRSYSLPIWGRGRSWEIAHEIEKFDTSCKPEWIPLEERYITYPWYEDDFLERESHTDAIMRIGRLVKSSGKRPNRAKALQILELIEIAFPYRLFPYMGMVEKFFRRIPDGEFRFEDLKKGLIQIGYWQKNYKPKKR